MTLPLPVDAVVIGGGPAGSAVGRLLASWGHAVLVLDKGSDRARGLAESLPPSTTKLLAQIGVLDAVEAARFYRTGGNTVWWASRERRVETFGSSAGELGYQVFRPDLDRVLLESAAAAGARVAPRAHVRRVTFGDDAAVVDYDQDGCRSRVTARFVIDCSGRAGVVGRRFRRPQPGHRACAMVGVWEAGEAWDLPDPTHTVVETFADGWAWSVPISESTRHVGVMIGRAVPADGRGRDLAGTYRSLIRRTTQVASLLRRASLEHVWACDASLYSAAQYAGPQFLLVGDAGSFIDPLSSFGVKKALASAWLGAVAAHTALLHRDRMSAALEFFSDWERRVYATHLQRSCAFARAANEEHAHPFWEIRAGAVVDAPPELDEERFTRDPDVQRAFERFKTAPHLDLVMSDTIRFEQRPVVRGHEIVLEEALAGGMRFVANVDLVKLAAMASSHRHVPDLFEAYCRSCPPVPLPNVLGGLSLLVARGVLHERT